MDIRHFGSYEGQRNETTNVVTSPLVPVGEREFPENNSRDQYFFKSDYKLPRNHRLSGRWRYGRSTATGQGSGGLNPRERGNDQKTKYQDGLVSLTSIASASTRSRASLRRSTRSITRTSVCQTAR